MPTALQSVAHTLMRVRVVVAGALLAMLALALGLLLALGVMVWALLRGRKPVRVQTFRWQGMSRPGRAPPDEVVDIEAHEVPEGKAAPRVLNDR
jgi:hypothetical protein